MRNYVTQCIGVMENEPKVAVSKGVDLQVGDALLLCSDGFWEYVSPDRHYKLS